MCFVIAFSPSVVGRAIDAAPGIERWDKCSGIPMDSLIRAAARALVAATFAGGDAATQRAVCMVSAS
jgi:hypothetical protein